MAMRAGLVDVGERRRLRVRTRSDSDGISTNVFVLTDLSTPKGCQTSGQRKFTANVQAGEGVKSFV